MTNPDPTSLDRLRDIVAPPCVPWWPPAPAWYWVLGFLLLAALALALRALIHWQRNHYRREALAELARQEAAFAIPAHRAAAVAALAALLKRAALSAWPRKEVAALHGAAWLAFLDHTGGSTNDRFRSHAGASLEGVAYDPRKALLIDEPTLRELSTLVRQWLRRHRADNTIETSSSGGVAADPANTSPNRRPS